MLYHIAVNLSPTASTKVAETEFAESFSHILRPYSLWDISMDGHNKEIQ